MTVCRHGGNVHAAARKNGVGFDEILDFSANINPLGAPEWLRPCISRELDTLLHYPEPYAEKLIEIIANRFTLSPDTVIAANGSTELLYQLPRVLDCQRAVIPVPCYIDYIKVMQLSGITIKTVTLDPSQNFQPDLGQISEILKNGDLCILGSPNNPTGSLLDGDGVFELAVAHPEVMFLIDEAFLEFVDSGVSVAGRADNILTLHSLTKFYAVPGLRLGFGVFPRSVAKKMRDLLPPWSVNSLAQKVGEKALLDAEYQKESRRCCRECREDFKQGLMRFPDLQVFPSAANYFLVHLHGTYSVSRLQDALEEQNILIRNCENYLGLEGEYFRIAVRSKKENRRFLDVLSQLLNVNKPTGRLRTRPKKTPALMFQGTSSNAGKSVLATALCRILLQDGLRVAPFKAQNMSLNSFVTLDGLEMGRAQVVQAQAARLDPDVRMNPILLKPNSDTGSQVIVHGRPIGNMAVMEYVDYKKTAMEAACKAYDELASEFQVIVLEGAGSPGEVNLKRRDIVNMRMARYAEAPVILVGDIDRGGVYASFVGTMEVLNQWERGLVAGFLVNRFRGDERLLSDAHDYVLQHTGREVLGVIPYLHDISIPEEDSVSFKDGLFEGEKPDQEYIDIALINLPHISNFTDLEALANEPDVYLRVVSNPSELGLPDVIILPGSKNVIGDIDRLLETGLAAEIQKHAEQGCEVVGICGGYQMLGQVIEDPHTIESGKTSVRGLSLIDMHTRLAVEKTLSRKAGIHLPSGQPVAGYEIHHGLTRTDGKVLFSYNDDSSCGTVSENGRIWGSYLHGLFDSDPFRRNFIDAVRKRKGMERFSGPFYSYDLEPAFDRLAAVVRKGLDMDRVYQLLGL